MITFSHLLLVRRDLRELKRFRQFVLEGEIGDSRQATVDHDGAGQCCAAESWEETIRTITETIKPSLLVTILNM